MIYFKEYQNKKKTFIELNRKSFLHKYITTTNTNTSVLLLGLGHQNNITYTTLLKFLNKRNFCLLFAKTNLILQLIQNLKIHKAISTLTNYIGLAFLFKAIANYTNIINIIENKTTFFFFFLIRNKLLLTKNRILRLLFYKTLFFYGFSHIFYNQLSIKNISLCF